MSNSNIYPDYRPCVGILLFKPSQGIWAGRRIDKFKEAWQMPQGGIDPGENPQLAALRELQEETSITSAKIIKEIDGWHKYEIAVELRPAFWAGKYIGQQQKWFIMEFTGQEAEINIATQDQEFIEWDWVTPEFLLKNTVAFKKEVYHKILAEFTKL